MNSQTIVGDSSPLISLALIGQLDLLPRLYQRVLIPPAVWNEVTVQGAGLPGAQAVSELTWLEIQEPLPAILQSLAILLDRGEAEAIALALGARRGRWLAPREEKSANRISSHRSAQQLIASGSTQMNAATDIQMPGVL